MVQLKLTLVITPAKHKYNLHKHMNIYTTAIKNTYLCKTST